MHEIIKQKINQLEDELKNLRDDLDSSENHFRNLKTSKEIEQKEYQLTEFKKAIEIFSLDHKKDTAII